jgi:gliding motility-associated-like protein
MQSCDISANSQHEVAWGCDGSICNSITQSDFLSVGQGEPNINIRNTQNQDAGYCQTGFTSLTVSNNGLEFDPGFGTMEDIDILIGLGGSFQSLLSGYNITGIRIGNTDITNWSTVMSLDTLMELTSDPDGPGGLEDLDGDGFFDDLGVDQSFEIRAFLEFDCGLAEVFSPADSCLNNFSTSLNARIDFTDACGERIQNLLSSFYRPTNGNSGFSSNSDTDAEVAEDIFYVVHRENRAVRNFDSNCPNGGIFIATVELPAGIQPVLAETRLVKNEASDFDLVNSSFSNGLLVLEFGGSLTQFLTGTYDLILAFEADCTAAPGPSYFPLTFEFSCPDCDCRHIWFCDELDGPWLHVNSPPCPPELALECPDGIQTTDFSVERTTFGFLDENFTTPFPPEEANKKVAISCDEIVTTIKAKVGDLVVNDSLGVFFEYENPDNSSDASPLFLFKEGNISFYVNGIENTCALDASVISFDGSGSTKKNSIYLGDCLQDLGLILNPGDSISFMGVWKINQDGPIPFQFREIPSFRGFAFAIRNGVEKWCDSYGEEFTVAKTNTVLDFPNSNDFPRGCEEVDLDFKIITVNNGFREYFGDELRPSVKVDSLVMLFDTAIFESFSDFKVEVLIPGHPVHGNAYFEIAPLTDFPDGRYVAAWDTLAQSPVFNTASNAPFTLRVNLTPSCKSRIGSSDSDNLYAFETSIWFADRFYASFIDDGSCVEERTETIEQEIAYVNPPEISFSPLSPTDFVLLGDTVVWTFQICNNSFIGSAGSTWLALESPNGAVEIVKAEDITNPDAVQNLSVYSYGTLGNNSFVLAEGLENASAQSELDDICNIIRVKGLVSVCGTSNLSAHAGWDCLPYDPQTWNPEDYPPCNESTIPLTISTRDPFLEADVISQPGNNLDICDTASMEIVLRNVDLGATFDLQSIFSFPDAGIAFVPGSFEIAYPSSEAFQPVLQDPIDEGMVNNRRQFRFDGFGAWNSFLADEGLPGFNAQVQSDSNEVKVRFQFVTDCNFENGSQIEFNFEGTKGCGGFTNFEAGESFPINVNDASLDPDKSFAISLVPDSRLNSPDASKIRILVKNNTNRASEPTDKMVVLLPQGLFYQTSTSTGLQPAGWMPGEPEIDILNGKEQLTWFIPSGLAQDEEAILEFEVGGVNFDCSASPMEINTMTLSEQKLFCLASLDTCKIDLSSSNSDPIQLIEIGGELEYELLDISANCTAQGELVEIQARLDAQGFDFNLQNVFFTIYEDQNQNNFPDAGERQEKLGVPAGMGTSHTFQINPGIAFQQLCALRLRVDSVNIPTCEVYDFELPEPLLSFRNSVDSFCSNGPLVSANLNNDPCDYLNYTWRVDPPDPSLRLRRANLPQPELDFRAVDEDRTILLVGEIQRPGCNSIYYDTIRVVVTKAPTIDLPASVNIQRGDSIELNAVVSGHAPLAIFWSPPVNMVNTGSPNPTVFPDNNQLYSIGVSDVNLCLVLDNIMVNVFAELNASVNVTDTLLCAGEGPMTIQVVGGNTINWTEGIGNPQTNTLDDYQSFLPTFDASVPGSYQFTGIVSDSNLPGVTDTVQVNIQLASAPVANAGRDFWACLDDSTRLSGSAGRGSPPYTFEWSGGYLGAEPTVFITQPDFFHLTVTDQNGCTGEDSVFVNAFTCPCDIPVVESTVEIHPDCNKDNGQIRINMKGKTSDFEFIWLPNIGTIVDENERTDLPVGIYDVRINRVDDPSCFMIYTVFLNPKGVPDITIDFDAASCGQEDGRVALTPLSFKYNWPDGTQAAERNDLAEGRYYVTVVDPRQVDCPYFLDIIVPGEISHQTNVVVNAQPTCGLRNGSVTLQTIGGSGNYDYSWPGGQASQDDLAEGLYLVTITDRDNPACTEEISFTLVAQNSPVDVTITDTIPVSCAGFENGGVRYTVQVNGGFLGQLDTLITNGFTQWENDSLPPGNYCLQIIDENDCLLAAACFEIKMPAPLSLQMTSYPDCNNDGLVLTTVSGGTDPYLFNWSDQTGNDNEPNRSGLSVGAYNLTVTDTNQCTVSGNVNIQACDTCSLWDDLGEFYLQAACGETVKFCIPDRNFRSDSLSILIDGAPYNGNEDFCEEQSVKIYSFQNLYGTGQQGPYQLDSWVVDGDLLTGIFTDLDSLASLMNRLDPGAQWTYDDGSLSIRGGNQDRTYGALDATQINLSISSTHDPSTLRQSTGYSIDLPVGAFTITVIDEISKCKDSVSVQVVCTQPDTLYVDLVPSQLDTICINTQELQGHLDTSYFACGLPIYSEVTILNDSCFTVTGLSPGTDTTCFVLCDSLGICDTTFVIIQVNQPPPTSKIWRDTILVGDLVQVCCDTSELQLSGPISSFANLCPALGNAAVDFNLDSTDFCVNYTGLMPGIDTACIQFCDTFGVCDTISFIIQVTMDETLYDTVYLGVDTVTLCLDTLAMDFTSNSFFNDCPVSMQPNVEFDIETDSLCITYSGVAVGVDSACLVMRDSLGNFINMNLVVTVISTRRETYCDTIFDGQTIFYCPPTNELPGQEVVSIFNECNDQGTGNVEFFENNALNCLEITGLSPGQDTACLVICDELGVCDTTNICITVEEYLDPPILLDDCDTTETLLPVVVNVKENDIVFGTNACPTIVEPPLRGEIRVNPDCSVSYVPFEQFCDGTDSFYYEICNGFGCDTAKVKVFVYCLDIMIFTALSPNRDGLNDFFYIGGLDDKPNNRLVIFNRWGNKVFEMESYDNTWDGTFDGKELPDGTYYYIFEVEDQGIMRTFNGYLELFR